MKRSQERSLDRLLLYRLRELTKDRCEECRAPVKQFASQTSHGFTRTLRGIRWDRLNVLHLCASCHFKYGDNPPLAERFLRKHLGDAGYTELCRRRGVLIQTAWLDYDAIRGYIANLTPGKYPKVSPKPLWEL